MSEDKEQSAVIKWSQQPSIRNRYPDLKLLHHIPNERKCSPAEGARLKRMGVKAGVPDLSLPVPKGRYHGLYIELKTITGRLSEPQKWWQQELTEQGYLSAVCYGWQMATDVIIRYLEEQL